jgi:hypothetical protein
MGFMAGHTAAVLARGVLTSMMLNQFKVATVLLCLGLGVRYWSWHAFAGPPCIVAETGADSANGDLSADWLGTG